MSQSSVTESVAALFTGGGSINCILECVASSTFVTLILLSTLAPSFKNVFEGDGTRRCTGSPSVCLCLKLVDSSRFGVFGSGVPFCGNF